MSAPGVRARPLRLQRVAMLVRPLLLLSAAPPCADAHSPGCRGLARFERIFNPTSARAIGVTIPMRCVAAPIT